MDSKDDVTDLVKRLRRSTFEMDGIMRLIDNARDAADRIEGLEEEIEGQRQEWENLRGTAMTEAARAEQAEAQVATLTQELRETRREKMDFLESLAVAETIEGERDALREVLAARGKHEWNCAAALNHKECDCLMRILADTASAATSRDERLRREEERVFCLCLLPEGPGVIRRVTGRMIEARGKHSLATDALTGEGVCSCGRIPPRLGKP